MKSPSNSICIVTHKMQHHGAHSGYDLLTKCIDGARIIQPFNRPLLSKLLAQYYFRRREPKPPVAYYCFPSFLMETAVYLDARFSRNNVYHYLYGEDHFLYTASLSGRRGTRFVATFHQPPSLLEKLLANHPSLDKLDAVIAVGSNQVDYLASRVGREKVHVVPHGVDVDFFAPGKPKAPRRQVVVVGSWLRDLEMLRATIDRMGSDVRFVIVTTQTNHARFAGLPNVELPSRLSDEALRDLYRSSDLVFLPLTDCTANNAILEAMACGTPAVVTDVGAIRDYADESCARFVPAGDADAVAREILGLLDRPDDRARLSAAAHQKALEFDWRRIGRRMLDIYNGLRGGSGA